MPADDNGRSHPTHRLAEVQAVRARLAELLLQLFPEDQVPTPIDVITLDNVLERYPLTGLGGPATTAIAQSQRIINASGDYEQMGLCEFHAGLIYLHWNHGHRAAQHFAHARQRWAFANRTDAECLASVAQALTERLTEQYESAVTHLGRATRSLERLKRSNATLPNPEWVKEVEEWLQAERDKLGQRLWPEHEKKSTAEQLPPQAADASNCPIAGHRLESNAFYAWYQVTERQQDHFLPHILPQMWLLVRKQAAVSEFEPRSLLLLSHRDAQGSIQLRPYRAAAQDRPLWLGRVDQEEAITPSVRKATVTLSARQHNVNIQWDDIVGLVVGYWATTKE